MTALLLSACAQPLLAPEDRARVCRVVVDEKPEALAFAANPMASPVGGPVLGTSLGLLALVAAVGFPPYVFVAPAVAVHGAACGAGSVGHPNADADFEKIFRSANLPLLSESLANELNAPRAGCPVVPVESSAAAEPDTVIEIESIAVRPGCAYGDWDYQIAVKWNIRRAAGGAALGATTTLCGVKTNREVDAWFGDRDQARTEIERVLAAIGQRLAAQLQAPEKLETCSVNLLPATGTSDVH